ncbi:MAG: hypothetical protein AAF311_10345, partial [Pseudomonadota bacterium]
GDLPEIHASGEVCKALSREDNCTNGVISEYLGQLLFRSRIKDAFAVPTFAFQVSGEFAMIRSASANGWGDSDALLLETLTAFKRAGCDAVLTYGAIRAAEMLRAG